VTPSLSIEVLSGASLDVDCTCRDELGAALDVSGANITFEVIALAPATLVPSGAQLFQRRNTAAGGGALEVLQPVPAGGTNTFRVRVIPSNTAARGRYHYRARVEWPAAVPPVARIWEGEFLVR
jgi:hypothetical protein